jgi:hypothetical protein
MIIIGRVCVPIDIKKCEDFNPLSVPTVSELCREINDYDKRHSEGKMAGEGGKKISGTVSLVFYKILLTHKRLEKDETP